MGSGKRSDDDDDQEDLNVHNESEDGDIIGATDNEESESENLFDEHGQLKSILKDDSSTRQRSEQKSSNKVKPKKK